MCHMCPKRNVPCAAPKLCHRGKGVPPDLAPQALDSSSIMLRVYRPQDTTPAGQRHHVCRTTVDTSL
jgi:hypothetical protein